MADWSAYHEQAGTTPNSLVVGVLEEHVKNRGVALDLGAGNLRDSVFLMGAGFKRVVAVDIKRPGEMPRMLEFHERDIATFRPSLNMFDLAVSCNTLFYLPYDHTVGLLGRVRDSLRPDGIFACNLLGEHADWATNPKVSVLSASQVEHLRHTFSPVALDEVEWDAPGANGIEQHWHMWNLIFRK